MSCLWYGLHEKATALQSHAVPGKQTYSFSCSCSLEFCKEVIALQFVLFYLRHSLISFSIFKIQGHLNDTIVVNQPRLTTEEDIMAEGAEEMEMTIVGEDELQGEHPVSMVFCALQINSIL